jgi:hypothetical protein
MNRQDESAVVAAIEGSAIVGVIQRAGTRLSHATQRSILLTSLAAVFRDAAARPGVTVLAAVLTHVPLVSIVARPPFWYWVIVPAICAAAGVMLLLVERPRGLRSE